MSRPAIHPGEILADELAEIGVSAVQLGRELHIPNNRIYQILSGKRAITADTALRLGRWFGTGAEFWMNLQASYDLRIAEQEHGVAIRETVVPRQESRIASPVVGT
jgi:addiction module HigA family antidote